MDHVLHLLEAGDQAVIEALGTVGSMLLLLWACATHQQHFTCAPGWWLPEGVRRDGDFACRRVPVGPELRDGRGVLIDRSEQPDGIVESRVYCTGGSVPVIGDDGRTVSCQARH